MVRECAACFLVLPAAGCSLVLDFSDSAIPDDAPYSQAECDYKEPNDTFATAVAIAPTDAGPAAICAGNAEDHDFYRFAVPAGTGKIEIRISTMYRVGGDLDLQLYDQAGARLARSTGFGNDEVIACPGASPACPALAAGDYVFEVYPAVAGSVNRYALSVALTAM